MSSLSFDSPTESSSMRNILIILCILLVILIGLTAYVSIYSANLSQKSILAQIEQINKRLNTIQSDIESTNQNMKARDSELNQQIAAVRTDQVAFRNKVTTDSSNFLGLLDSRAPIDLNFQLTRIKIRIDKLEKK